MRSAGESDELSRRVLSIKETGVVGGRKVKARWGSTNKQERRRGKTHQDWERKIDERYVILSVSCPAIKEFNLVLHPPILGGALSLQTLT